MSLDIVGIGLSAIDHLFLLDDVSRLPGGVVLDYSIQGGGPTATALAAASTLGSSCGMIASIGDDAPGKEILAGLQRCGVDTSHSVIQPGASSPVILVLVDARTGDRHFLSVAGPMPSLLPHRIDWQYVAQARIVHFDTFLGTIDEVVQKASELDVTISADASVEAGLAAPWVPFVDVFIAGADRPEWREQPDRALAAARLIADRGPQIVILTLGAAGSVGTSPEGPFRTPAFPVSVVDTTGTGDVFHGAFLYGTCRGWSVPDCALFASAAAALSATKLGGRAGLAKADQVAASLLSHRETGPWSA